MKIPKHYLLFTIILGVFLTIFVFQSCKKGEDDPFLSLWSRKHRLTGKWKVKELYASITYTDSTLKQTLRGSIKFNGNYMEIISGTAVQSYPYYESLTINRDGTFNQEIISNNIKQNVKGIWYWVGKNKDIGLKNKEAVSFVGFIINSGTFSSNYSSISIAPTNTLIIKELRNNELVISYNYTQSDSKGYYYSYSGTTVYGQ
ncbi:MAG: hypothetical protein KA792_09755 [Bacteroidales bacterium]|nr:hypothetical protein [Bacteroidales bacterium]